MLRPLIAALICAAFVAAGPIASARAQTAQKTEEKADANTTIKTKKSKKAKKKDEAGTKQARTLTPQQQKMKDCGAKWQEEKKAKNVKGNEAYRKFLSSCLKG